MDCRREPALLTTAASGSDPKAALLAAGNADLGRRLVLAGRDSLYLVLDLGSSTLSLFHGPARLRDFPVLGLEVGARRSLLGHRSVPRDWDRSIWRQGAVRPARRELSKFLDVSADDYEARRREILVPPTPDESQPSPAAWAIAFRDHRVLEVVGDAPPHANPGSAVPRGIQSRLRRSITLRVYLGADDAAALYRGLPGDVTLALTGGFAAPAPSGPPPRAQGAAPASNRGASSGAIRARSWTGRALVKA
jgi:hypothetical protein